MVEVHAVHTPFSPKKYPDEQVNATVADVQDLVLAAQATQVAPEVKNPYDVHPDAQAAVELAAQATQVEPEVTNPAVVHSL